MENASKAILIAGGVLLAIMVISMCMFVIYNARDAFSSMEQKKQAQIVQEQMAKFAQYVGPEPIYGSEVSNCMKRIASYNAANPSQPITCGHALIADNEKTSLYQGTMITNGDGTINTINFNP